MRKIIVSFVLGSLILGAAWGWHKTGPLRDRITLRREAQVACLCERRQGPAGKTACWAQFEQDISPKHAKSTTGNDTFCGIVSPAFRYWHEQGEFQKVVTHYLAPGGASSNVILCTHDEAERVELAMQSDLDAFHHISSASLKMARDIAAGKPIEDTASGPSCI